MFLYTSLNVYWELRYSAYMYFVCFYSKKSFDNFELIFSPVVSCYPCIGSSREFCANFVENWKWNGKPEPMLLVYHEETDDMVTAVTSFFSCRKWYCTYNFFCSTSRQNNNTSLQWNQDLYSALVKKHGSFFMLHWCMRSIFRYNVENSVSIYRKVLHDIDATW